MRGTFLGELRHLALDHARVDPIAARLGALLGHFLQQQTMALPFFGASIPGFVGLLTGRGPFSPAFALIPGRSQTIPLLEFGRRGTLALWQPRLQDLEQPVNDNLSASWFSCFAASSISARTT